jgi:hypothetical protein
MKSPEKPFESSSPLGSSASFEMIKPKKVSPETSSITDKSEMEKKAELKDLEEIIEEVEQKRDNLKKAIIEGNKESEATAINELNESLGRARIIKRKIEGKTILEPISAEFTYKDEKGKEKSETIKLDFEKQLESFRTFYEKYKIDLPSDFSENMTDIWERNRKEMEKAIEEKGFDTILFVPDKLPNLSEINKKMSEGYVETYKSSNFKEGGAFEGVMDAESGARIILVHISQNIRENPVLKETLGKKAEELIKVGETMTLTDYFILQRKVFDETGKHLDSGDTWAWLPGSTVKNPGGGLRVVSADWGGAGLNVFADDPVSSYSEVGCRLSRCFK